MKLLVLDQFSEMGGAQQALAELLPAMSARGWTGTVALPGDGELFERARAAGFAAERIACGPYHSGHKTAGDAVHFAGDTLRLAARVRSLASGMDLIYVNGPRVLPGPALARTRRPIIFHAHSMLPRSTVRVLARAASRVIASCEFVAKPWRDFLGSDAVRVIYNGVSGPPEPLWRTGGLRVGCVGRIAPEKGQLEFVHAARKIHREIPSATFAIFGAALFGEGDAERYASEVREEAAGLPVEFAGWCSDVYRALARIDLLLVPSAGHEATTRVILEAHAAGVPVIAFRSGGIPEVVQHGSTGFLVDSTEEMARVAVECLPGDALATISCAARRSWETRFTQARYQGEVLAAIAASVE